LRRRDALVLLGDFNIISPEHETMKALTDNGFVVPEVLKTTPSNAARSKHYDQIAFKAKPEVIAYLDSALPSTKDSNAGVFDFYQAVFRAQDEAAYAAERAGVSQPFGTWRTYQMSDHLPMWVRLDINDVEPYLDRIAAED
jgi:endonuclease/exonuclease/phosphatase family metal-dependent hydrolase